ncbi:MAG: carbon monoxide dehydrogenase [Candidatus Heimdallarchaeota archaeon]
MKLAITGKGGTGKTLLAATISRILAKQKTYSVLAVDADSNPSLAGALGIPEDIIKTIIPLSENQDLIEARTGMGAGAFGAAFRLNPQVRDLIEKLHIPAPDGVRLLVMGTVQSTDGCMCPAFALIRALIRYLILKRDEMVVLDLEAGVEVFGRRVVEGMDAVLAVLEPSKRAVMTLERVVKLANKIQVRQILAVANKIESEGQAQFLKTAADQLGIPLLGKIPRRGEAVEADLHGIPLIDYSPESPVIQSIESIIANLLSRSS